MSNSDKELALENLVESCLEQLRRGGIVKEYHRLVRSHSYPDFYVRDAKGREWLLECKNITQKKHSKPGKHAIGYVWEYRPGWVKTQILNKKWNEASYPIRDGASQGIHSRVIVSSTQNLRPMLVTSFINLIGESRRLLGGFRFVVFAEPVKRGSQVPHIYDRLTQHFSSP